MHKLTALMTMVDDSVDTKKKRHLAGGILMSVALLFCGLTFTVMTLKMEDKDE